MYMIYNKCYNGFTHSVIINDKLSGCIMNFIQDILYSMLLVCVDSSIFRNPILCNGFFYVNM